MAENGQVEPAAADAVEPGSAQQQEGVEQERPAAVDGAAAGAPPTAAAVTQQQEEGPSSASPDTPSIGKVPRKVTRGARLVALLLLLSTCRGAAAHTCSPR